MNYIESFNGGEPDMDDVGKDPVIHAERALRYLSKILESGFNTRSILEAQRTLHSGVV